METTEIVKEIDAEIARLQQVRALLSGGQTGNGRVAARPGKKGTMSAEGRARIAAAQKKRWAKLRKMKKPV
jgi:hypothetical protein